jgi:uncharacterized protein YwgA
MQEEDYSGSRKGFILELLARLGKIEGRTRLQKIVFLGQMELGLPKFFEFDKYYYGPYSWELTETLEDLILTGQVKEESESFRDFVTYIYSLTDFGLTEMEKAARYIPEEKIEILKKLSEIPRSALIEYVYRKYRPERLAA